MSAVPLPTTTERTKLLPLADTLELSIVAPASCVIVSLPSRPWVLKDVGTMEVLPL